MSVKIVKAVFDRSPQKGSTRNVLLALAEWADDSGICYPAVSSIAIKARVSETTVHSAVRRLVAGGELVVTPNAGRHGTNVYRILDAGGQQLALLEGGASSEGGAESAPVLLAAPEPSSPRTSSSRRGTDGLGADSGRGAKSAPPPGRTIPDRAQRLWLGLRQQAKLQRWTDPPGLRVLGDHVVSAVRDGATWPDVDRALRAKASDRKASAFYADEWIRAERLEREDREHREGVERRRLTADREHDDRVADSWRVLEAKYPGKKHGEIAELERLRRTG